MFYFKLVRLLNKKSAVIVLAIALIYSFIPATTNADLVKRVFLVSGTSWSVPSDFSTSSNTIEAIGSGGDGANGANGGGGGGGGYAAKTNQNITGTITYQIGSGGSDTVFNSTTVDCTVAPTPTVCADGGTDASGTTDGTGGTTANSVGTTEFAGGNGGGGGGGGAAGPAGAGSAGVAGAGGASGGGGAGATSDTYDAESMICTGGSAAGSGNEWAMLPTPYGSGGGGAEGTVAAGAIPDCAARAPANYGGGGSGGTSEVSGSTGGSGIIVITYASTEVGASSVAKVKIIGGQVKIIGGRVVII